MYNQNMKLSTSIKNISPTDSLQAQEAVCALASEGVAAIIGPNYIESSGEMCFQFHLYILAMTAYLRQAQCVLRISSPQFIVRASWS